MSVSSVKARSSKLFVLVLILVTVFSGLGTASDFSVHTEDACVQTILARCDAGRGNFQLPDSCTEDGFETALEENLDSIANSSVNCDTLDEDKLRSIEKPSEPVNELSKFILPVIGLLVLFTPLILPLLLASHYGKDLSEKFLLSGYWLLNLVSIPLIGFFNILFFRIVAGRFNFPRNPALLLGVIFAITLSLIISWLAAKIIKFRSELSDRRLFLVFFTNALIFWFILIAAIFSMQGQLGAYY